MATNPDHEDYLTPRPAPRKPPPKPKPYAASKAEKEQQEAAVAEGGLPLCTSLLMRETSSLYSATIVGFTFAKILISRPAFDSTYKLAIVVICCSFRKISHFMRFRNTAVPKSIPLESEVWYHGPMTRAEAELLLEDEGDFLVRESKSKAGQYVLSGVQNGQPRHLLLVDPEGKVCTVCCYLRLEQKAVEIEPFGCSKKHPDSPTRNHT